MKLKLHIIFSFLFCISIHSFGAVNDTIHCDGIQYKVTKEDTIANLFEVHAIHYDSVYIIFPDFVEKNGHIYFVTDAVVKYDSTVCSLQHYSKIDMSAATHITHFRSLWSESIAIDSLILPPNLMSFPRSNMCQTVETPDDSLKILWDKYKLLPGIHRVWSSGTQELERLYMRSCTSLLEVDLSSYTSITLAGMLCFSSDPWLQKLKLPNTLKVIPDYMLDENFRLTEFSIPDSVEYIGILGYGPLLDTLYIGKKVSGIKSGAFGGLYKLRHIEVDTANLNYASVNGVLYHKDLTTLFAYPYGRSDSIFHMLPTTEKTHDCAFYVHSNPFFNDDEVRLDKEDFKRREDSLSLRTIVCTNSLKELGEMTFENSTIKRLINFEETQVKVIPYSCFRHSSIETLALPYGLTKIEASAFEKTWNLTSITNMDWLTNLHTIGQSAFKDAHLLDSLDFWYCNLLVELPKYMCYNDSSLRHVSFPRNIKSIGNNAFKNCISLQHIICPAVVPIPIDSSVFEGVDKQKCVLKIHARSLDMYKSAPVWKEFFNMDTTGLYYIQTSVSDSLAGYVTGGGIYQKGEYAILKALANNGYEFVKWSDGEKFVSRVIHVLHDDSLKAIFRKLPEQPKLYTLTIATNDSSMGQVTGSGQYTQGTEVNITAIPYDGHYLQSWSFTDSQDKSVLYTMPAEDVTLQAIFAPLSNHLETQPANSDKPQLVVKNGHIFIKRNGKYYTLSGDLGIEE